MYKIMLADDEGIAIDSLKFIIEKNFGRSCEIRYAKTGRKVIELAEEFRPDIAFMDIQMPGINGIDAMKEIKKFNQGIIFIVMTAYDKFDFAKESINLGVLEYLTKPSNQNKIVETLEKAIAIVNREREKRSNDLEIREKLETVVPLLESSFIYNVLFQENYEQEIDNFKQLLNISQNYGFVIVLGFGDQMEDGKLSNPVGVSVKAQKFYPEFREIVKEFYPAIIGPIMANRIVIIVPEDELETDYEKRIKIIDTTRNLARKLRKRLDIQIKAGIGSGKTLEKIQESYNEAVEVLRINSERVGHVEDLPILCRYEDNYPVELEKELFAAVHRADTTQARIKGTMFFDWMTTHHMEYPENIKLKVAEFVLYAEHLEYASGGKNYNFRDRSEYLTIIQGTNDLRELKEWFVKKITDVCCNMHTKKEEQSSDIIKKAKRHIIQNFNKDISLDEVSKIVNISPYYFSKLFKEETKENFIDFLTNIRIEKSKELLKNQELSMKEICLEVGYSDPNYFSRIFKKCVGVTPTEYKEGY
ncbi:MAG TPA: response regulator [Candidatus Merdenecus merdavium]|nr:response regulator [Candidatus Merdenecus merdavium]